MARAILEDLREDPGAVDEAVNEWLEDKHHPRNKEDEHHSRNKAIYEALRANPGPDYQQDIALLNVVIWFAISQDEVPDVNLDAVYREFRVLLGAPLDPSVPGVGRIEGGTAGSGVGQDRPSLDGLSLREFREVIPSLVARTISPQGGIEYVARSALSSVRGGGAAASFVSVPLLSRLRAYESHPHIFTALQDLASRANTAGQATVDPALDDLALSKWVVDRVICLECGHQREGGGADVAVRVRMREGTSTLDSLKVERSTGTAETLHCSACKSPWVDIRGTLAGDAIVVVASTPGLPPSKSTFSLSRAL